MLGRAERRLLGVLAGALLFGCGRSGLDADEPVSAGGSGGVAGASLGGAPPVAGGTTGAPSGGFAGSSGGAAGIENAAGSSSLAGSGGQATTEACNGFVSTDVIDVQDAVGATYVAPRLLLSSDDGSRVTLAYRGPHYLCMSSKPPPFPCPLKTALHHLDFEPWTDWPSANIGPAIHAGPVGLSYAIGDAPGDAHAMLFDVEPPYVPDYEMRFAPVVAPNEAWDDIFPASVPLESVAAGARFAVWGSGEHFIGYQVDHALRYGRFAEDGSFALGAGSGCATGSIAATAIAAPNGGFLLATSSSRPAGSCQDGSSIDGSATRVQLIATPDAQTFIAQLDIELGAPIQLLRLVPRPGGAWLVWRLSGDGTAPTPIFAQRVDGAGAPVGNTVTLLGPSDGAGAFALAELGDRLALVHVGLEKGMVEFGLSLTLHLFDDVGTELWHGVIRSLKSGGLYGPALLAAPNGKQLLVAWWNSAPLPGQDDTLDLMRLDCD